MASRFLILIIPSSSHELGTVLQARLKYAMSDVILDLVSTRKGLNPERINIGLRAFLIIADNLEKNVS